MLYQCSEIVPLLTAACVSRCQPCMDSSNSSTVLFDPHEHDYAVGTYREPSEQQKIIQSLPLSRQRVQGKPWLGIYRVPSEDDRLLV